jgi:uncharacterized phage infection (PIP) family protein YhgE
MKETPTLQDLLNQKTKMKSNKVFEGPDRFDLEQSIMAVWGLEDDLDALYSYLYETDADADTVANAILGAKVLHTARCTKLWDIFTKLVKTKQLTEDTSDTVNARVAQLQGVISKLREDNANLLAALHESYENCESIVKYEGLGPGQAQQGMSLREQLASAIRLKAKEVSEEYVKYGKSV